LVTSQGSSRISSSWLSIGTPPSRSPLRFRRMCSRGPIG
jgi:hypothetical protein